MEIEEITHSKFELITEFVRQHKLVCGAGLFFLISFSFFIKENNRQPDLSNTTIRYGKRFVFTKDEDPPPSAKKAPSIRVENPEEIYSSDGPDVNVEEKPLQPRDVRRFMNFYIAKANHKERIIIHDLKRNSDSSSRKQLRSQLMAIRAFRQSMKNVNPNDRSTWKKLEEKFSSFGN